jgi:hypothetical protein
MNKRVYHLVVVVCLSMIEILVVLGSVQLRETTYAVPSPSEQGISYVTASSSASPILEPRVYLPAVMLSFCVPISIPTDAKLFGVVFFDHNGDGSQQPNEPGIAGASVSVGNQSTSSYCNGVYYFRNLPDGSHSLVVTADGFRYLSLSRSDFEPIGTPVLATVSGNTQQDVGLMQGFLTLPYSYGTTYNIGEYFDYDPEYGKYLWWNGQQGSGAWRNHVGTDLGVSVNGVPVVAPAPGEVIWLGEDPNGGWGIDARTPDGMIWGAFHVTPTIALNQTVSRGDTIGFVNFPGAPHVHLDVKLFRVDGHLYFPDIYVPLDSSICAEWRFVPGSDPEYVKTDCSPGYWTVRNSPQHTD